ncbi:TPA: hypothetical protein N0F65_002935 [Lagenidium giganteum]|uniref:ABC transporter domain-containing protein n=1 Tax=Lagenidium giganteum TaxID=4803 RepID=A0AAV2Z8H1_9STRA|nr:TPA: hypothetical protein N0F65_002935 [Lagenidium giganteum]
MGKLDEVADAARVEEHVHETVVPTDAGGHEDNVSELPVVATAEAPPSPSRTRHSSVDEYTDQVSELADVPRTGSREGGTMRMKSAVLERYSSLDTSNIETLLSGGLDRFYGKYKNAWKKNNLSFPTPEIIFENLAYSVWVSNESPTTRASIGGVLKGLVAPWRKLKTVKKKILHPMSGIIRPGTMTLILANPGAGKSTFLKALAGKLKVGKGRSLKGNITYSGLPAEDINISKLIGLVDQSDNHFATLTVRETIQFADRCLNAPPESQPPKLREVARLRTDLCLHILGLTKCADTVVGDALLRGVSGGERKRVTLGEMLVGGQSVFLCDEISTGLDSAATFDIMRSLRSWTRTLGGSAVVSLLQPPPEVVELFDDILVMTEGRLVYHGPRSEMLPYFHGLGFACPARIDPAEFVVDVISGRGAPYLIKKSHDEAAKSKPPRKAEKFEEAFLNSELYQRTARLITEKMRYHDKKNGDGEMQRMAQLIGKQSSQSLYRRGFFESTGLLLRRQRKIWVRDKALIYGKLVEAMLVGLLLGIIYFKAPKTIYMRMIFFCIAIFQRQAWQQLSISFQTRNVFYKQRSRMFFRSLSYTVAESVVQMPLNVCVSLVLVIIFYLMAGMARTASTFFVFYAIILCFQHTMSAYFALLASISPSLTVAQGLASLSVSFFLLFSGNIILPLLIPSYWLWMHWYNPLAWALRAALLNEFHDAHYTEAERNNYLVNLFQVVRGPEYIWIGIIVLICYYILFVLLNTLVLTVIQYETTSTASVAASSDADGYTTEEKSKPAAVRTSQTVGGNPANANNTEVVVQVPPDNEDSTSGKTFIPGYLAVRNLDYFVKNPAGSGELQLLHGVTAHFTPGKMTALMGSSGAGKTTFMDVVAGRKTGGRIIGDILVNGEPKDPRTFSRISGYCEQMDIHSGGATVLEALEFSARLRLSAAVSDADRAEIVQNTMNLLELTGIAFDLVRNCSIEQKKRITIGVEMVANPSILFLDEPTSGLDARSASIVMRGVVSIARTGRTVVCTIHQPSTQIFELFDSLLLLQKGGYTAFFGELGQGSEKMVQYFMGIPGTAPIQPLYNPATYMLEVIGAGIGRGQARDYSVEYKQSALYQSNLAITNRIAEGKALGDSDEVVTQFSSLQLTPIATGFWNQFSACVRKMTLTYWRNPHYNFMRMVAFPVYATIFGTTFFQLPELSAAQVNSHVGLLYNSLDFIGVINLMTVLDTITSERAVFYRERMSNYYGPLSYALSLPLAELPYLVWISLFFVVVEYWLVGWQAAAAPFFLFCFVFFVHISICTSVGQFMAVLMPNVKVANVAVGALSVFFNLFSGYLMPFMNMRGFYSWIRWLVPTAYSLQSLMTIELGQCDHDGVSQHGCTEVTTATGDRTRLVDFIYKHYGFKFSAVGDNIAVLIGMWCFLQVMIYLTLRFVSHLKR